MSRLLILAVLSAICSGQALLPETWREHKRVKNDVLAPENASLWAEFGGESAEKSVYNGPAGRFDAYAWRLKDSTSALAWYQALRPENAVPVRGASLLSTTPGSLWVAHQNYVLRFDGWRPTAKEFDSLWPQLPQLRSGGGLPVLASYLPEKDRVRNSERYILGVASLAQFAPQIPPTLPGFELGAEAQMGRFSTRSGAALQLLLISYPTPQVARVKAAEFEQQAGWVIHRSGSNLTVIPTPPDRSAAETLANSITYQQNFMWNEAVKVPTVQDAAKMILAIFELAGVLLVICLGGGILFALLWFYLRRSAERRGGRQAAVTILDLHSR
jgi:hypothetical protein